MDVLLLGSGGREHALAWKLAASPLIGKLYAAPGNPGIATHAQCVELNLTDHGAVIAFCRKAGIGLVVVGPEAPLVAGIADALAEAGIRAFGPRRLAARLEGSKGFTKDLCAQFGIPTAAYRRTRSRREALDYLGSVGAPVVVKADGLAAGKGVTVARTKAEAEQAIDDLFAGRYGDAGSEAVIEECLEGEEASFFAITDGVHALALATAQDHKRAHDGDQGPNTGGMGAYSPAPVMTEALCEETMARIVEPTIRAMTELGAPYQGILYAGLMLTGAGPKLIEYNVRFGDPECQVLMPRLKDDLLTLLLAATDGTLDKVSLRWRDESALTVVMAARGYPGTFERGTVIGGLDRAAAVEGVEIFHAGTALRDGQLVASGGRVLGVTASADSIAEARARAYRAVDLIDWPEGFCRRDIGRRA
ncbi:MAG: phosphoribosylamine--glycine ligase [Pseudomonadota bacterium]|nr:phosphoribosylamine--glycine ligase [Pseudomonadota bacterium]